MDGNRLKELLLQRLKKLRVTAAINKRFRKNLLIFKRFEAFTTTIPKHYDKSKASHNYSLDKEVH